MKNTMLKTIAKAAEKAVKDACGSKSTYWYYEVEMPKCLKDKKADR